MDDTATARVVHALVATRMDYCNALCYDLPAKVIGKLQRAQNAAARLVTKTKKFDHITPHLKALHWLPARQRIAFKVLIMVYKAVHKDAPRYICELVTEKPSIRSLRSGGQRLLVEPPSRLRSYGDRAFKNSGPRLWNKLPLYIREADTLVVLKNT